MIASWVVIEEGAVIGDGITVLRRPGDKLMKEES
jgi:hypothetical protein